MAVIIFQLIIIASIAGAYWIKPHVAIWVAALWSLETVTLLFFPPLIFVQLIVVWGTYFMLRTIGGQRRRIDQLEDQLCDHPQTTREHLREIDQTHLQFISGKDHSRILREAITNSSDQLCVLSGWISHRVVDSHFINNLESALIRGVSVFFAYGFEDPQGTHLESPAANHALSILGELQRRSRLAAYRGNLCIGKFANHEKMLVKDDDFVVCGSNNWLSNTAFRNSERSVVVRETEFARSEGKRIAKLVSENWVELL